MNELVSIIVPIYNSEKYIEDCLKSISNQSYKNIEVILIDDKSKDKTVDILRKLIKNDKRFTLIEKNINSGCSDSRNLGLGRIRGKYVAFIDSDDIVNQDYIKDMLNSIIKSKSDICVCNYYEVKNGIKRKVDSNLSNQICEGEKFLFEEGFCGFCWNKLYKSELIGDTKFNTNLNILEDLTFNLLLWKKKPKVFYLNSNLYEYNININSLSHNKNYMGALTAYIEIIKILGNMNSIYENILKQRYCLEYLIARKNDIVLNDKLSDYFKDIFNVNLLFKKGKIKVKYKIMLLFLILKIKGVKL